MTDTDLFVGKSSWYCRRIDVFVIETTNTINLPIYLHWHGKNYSCINLLLYQVGPDCLRIVSRACRRLKELKAAWTAPMLLHLTEFHSYYSTNFVIDFNILPQDSGTYDSDSDTLNLSDPPRWDVAVLPSASYLVNAFYTNNPGAWLLHCHVGWHTSEGFALRIVERYSETAALLALVPLSTLALLESLCFRG